MSHNDESERCARTRPSLIVSLPIEIYNRRIQRLQEEANPQQVTPIDEEDEHTEEDLDVVGETVTEEEKNSNENLVEEKPAPTNNEAPLTPSPGYLGLPTASFQTPRPVQQQNYTSSRSRLHPYRFQSYIDRIRRAYGLRDSNNNITTENQNLTLERREN